MQKYNDRFIGKGNVNIVPDDEIREAIEKVENGSKSEKYLSVLIEAASRYSTKLAKCFYYNEEDGSRWCGRLKEMHCPTCGKKIRYGVNRKASVEPCGRCKQMVEVTQEMLDSR